MQKGDLATRDPRSAGRPHHVMVWVRLVSYGLPENFVGPLPSDYYGYEYEIWESTSDDDEVVRRFTRTGDARTHFRQWIDNVVFTDCD